MSDFFGRLQVVEPAADMLSLPAWAAGALAAVLIVACLMAFNRAGRDGPFGGLAPIALLLLGASITWVLLEGSSRRDVVAERQALDARATELTAHAIIPGSALSCLNALAGDTVESSCEKALFASPEAAAAAVTYVSAQLTLLADAARLVRRDPGYAATASGLRKPIEADRFGIVAHVLETRGCTADQCGAFALLNDASRVRTHLAERPYALYVSGYAEGWPTPAGSPVARATPPPALAAAPAALPGGLRAPGPNVFFPSAASIPPVNIMNAEPPAPDVTGTAPQQAAKPTAPQRKAAVPARRPVDLNADVGRGAPPAAAVQ
jgi:hypothetical protein